jgi:peptide/nickel transport system permease protein
VIPCLFFMVSVLGINLFGDALRDAFDVREEEA